VRRPVAFAAAALVALVASGAGASDVTVRGSVVGEYLYDSEFDGSVFDGRVEFDAESGPFLVGAVYRAYQLSDPDYNPVQKEIPASQVKHRYAEFRGESLTARGGHFFATFGRGISLRSYEDADLEHDTVLDGVLVHDERLSDSRTRRHTARGIEVAGSPWDWASVGASAVERSWLDEDEDIVLPPDQTRGEDLVLSGSADLRLGPASLAGEYARRGGENPVTGAEMDEGRALYLSGTFDLGWATLFGEFKDYDRFAHRLVNPPTCVRDHAWTLMNRATYEVDLDDERGFLGEGTVPLGDALSVTGGASEARDHEGELAHWEMYGEVSHTLFEALSGAVAGAWSREYLLGKFTEHASGAAEFDVVLPSGQTVEIVLEAGTTEDVSGLSWEDHIASLTWYPGADLTVTAVYEGTTSDIETRDSWLIGEVRKRVSDQVEVALAAGTERGGKQCSGGVCRYEPQFEGVRLRLNSYF
jgi:hypothetical protein